MANHPFPRPSSKRIIAPGVPRRNYVLAAVVACIILGLVIMFGLVPIHDAPNPVDARPFEEVISNASADVSRQHRGKEFQDKPLNIVFAGPRNTPFNFKVNLSGLSTNGQRSLWLYTGQAHDHGKLRVDSGGKPVGVLNNIVSTHTSGPVFSLSYVGDVNVEANSTTLNFTAYRQNSETYYTELGLVVLAPKGMSKDRILASLDAGRPNIDIGMLLILMGIAYLGLMVVWRAERAKAIPRSLRLLATLSLLVVCVLYVFSHQPASSPLEDSSNATRYGVAKAIDSGVQGLLSNVKDLSKKLLPLHRVADDVPRSFQSNSGTFETEVYRTVQNTEFEKISKKVMFGLIDKIQSADYARIKLGIALLLGFIFACMLLDRFRPTGWTTVTALGSISLLSAGLSMRLSEGWDEMFINLRHSYFLYHKGIYSFNGESLQEATVDLIPLVATAALRFLGIDLHDGIIIVSLLGNALIILFAYYFVRKLVKDRTWALFAALLAGCYPNVLWVGASGFTATFFTAWLLWASYFLLFTERRILGLVLLATLTLVRTEGILYAALLSGYVYGLKPLPDAIRSGQWREPLTRALKAGSFVGMPFVLSLIARKIAFGYPMPTPVTFKNTNFDASYAVAGIGRFWEMITTHDLHLQVCVLVLLLITNVVLRREGLKNLIVLNVCIFIFILPYYAGGGDWFPIYWNRYSMPFNVVLVPMLMVLLYRAFVGVFPARTAPAFLSAFCVVFVAGYAMSIKSNPANFLVATNKAVSLTMDRWPRIDNLSSLGFFLKDALPPDATVSSPEEATIMYFSEREMVGLLGVSNPVIAHMPLQPLNPGDIMHRKRGHVALSQSRPDVLALWEPVANGDFSNNAVVNERIDQVLRNDFFSPHKLNVAYYRIGSFESLKKMGYQHMTIVLRDRVFSIFVSKRIHGSFVQKLESKGYTRFGTREVPYSVDSHISRDYAPAAPEIMNML